ncbi:MAG TPA: CoA-transferase [Thermodesulfobacteriota bacterium]
MTAGRDVATQMIVAMARRLRDGETVFYGVASPLPLLATRLAQRRHAPRLTPLNIPGGVGAAPPAPRSGSTVGSDMLTGSPAVFPLMDTFDLSARGGLDVVFLSGVQIDPTGAINMSAIGDLARPRTKLPGGAGSACLMPTARRVLLWRSRHDPRSFVERLDFRTAAGNVDAVVTPLAVLARVEGRLAVESVHEGVTLDEVRAATGFPIGPVGGREAGVPVTPPPTADERAILDDLDPARVRDLEFR